MWNRVINQWYLNFDNIDFTLDEINRNIKANTTKDMQSQCYLMMKL